MIFESIFHHRRLYIKKNEIVISPAKRRSCPMKFEPWLEMNSELYVC